MSKNNLKKRIIDNLKRTIKFYRSSQYITLNEGKQIINNNSNAILIDVRSNQEYQEYHVDGAICIPYYEICRRIEKVVPNKNSIVVLYCQSGIRSKKAWEILVKKGYQNVYSIENGLDG